MAQRARRPAAPREAHEGGGNAPPLDADATPERLAHNPQKLPHAGGRRLDLSDPDAAAPEEPGVSVEPMEVGVQFLRDATEQYNFESELRPEVDHGATGAPLGQFISDATLEAAEQVEFELPVSSALGDETPSVVEEPEEPVVDMGADAIVGASLFDRPSAEAGAAPDGEGESDADDFSTMVAAPLHEPRVVSDDPSDEDEQRRAAIQRALDERVRKRLRGALPKDVERKEAEQAAPVAPRRGGAPERSAGRAARAARPTATASRRERHFARAVQTSREAASVVRDMTGLDDAVAALAALEVVAGGLVRRVTPGEASDLIAQLPHELHDVLSDLPAGPDDELTRESIEAELAARLSVDMERASELVRGVGMALRRLVSPGEIEDLLSQLPREMRAMIPDAVPHPTP